MLLCCFAKGAGDIRIPIGLGLAGHVATTGETINIEDAYTDDRFDRTMDGKNGYRTRSVLAMAVRDVEGALTGGAGGAGGGKSGMAGKVTGVIQVINKVNGTFQEDDVALLQHFSLQVGTAVQSCMRLRSEREHATRSAAEAAETSDYLVSLKAQLEDQLSAQQQLSEAHTSETAELQSRLAAEHAVRRRSDV